MARPRTSQSQSDRTLGELADELIRARKAERKAAWAQAIAMAELRAAQARLDLARYGPQASDTVRSGVSEAERQIRELKEAESRWVS